MFSRYSVLSLLRTHRCRRHLPAIRGLVQCYQRLDTYSTRPVRRGITDMYKRWRRQWIRQTESSKRPHEAIVLGRGGRLIRIRDGHIDEQFVQNTVYLLAVQSPFNSLNRIVFLCVYLFSYNWTHPLILHFFSIFSSSFFLACLPVLSGYSNRFHRLLWAVCAYTACLVS